MEKRIKLTKQDAAPILGMTFPDYNGRKFFVVLTYTVTFCDTNWSGGTCNKYAAVNRQGQSAHLYVPAPWVNPVEGKIVELTPDVIVAEHSYFCGKDCGITFYMHPSNAPKWLPAQVA